MKVQMTKLYKIKPGATKHLKENNYWVNSYPETVDGMIGSYAGYTKAGGDNFHTALLILNMNFYIVLPQEYIEEYK